MPSATLAAVDPELRGGAASASGCRGPGNQDAFLCGPVWFAVADGMGGHRAGDVASRLAVEELRSSSTPGSIGDAHAVVERANSRIRAVASGESASGMGATLVAAARMGRDVAVVSIGDSRCYRLSEGALTLVTRDHSHVQELVDVGRLTPGEAERHPLRHVVTRALGVDARAQSDVTVLHPRVGRLLLCSDGLTTALTPQTLGRVLAGVSDPRSAAERLVELAVAVPARDDATAVVLDVWDRRA